jgi:hypothetical protein
MPSKLETVSVHYNLQSEGYKPTSMSRYLKLKTGMTVKSVKLSMATNYPKSFCRLAHRDTSNKSGLTAALQPTKQQT